MRKFLCFLTGLTTFALFGHVHQYANTMRSFSGIGGEIAILFIPFIIWMVYRNIKDVRKG